MTRQLLQCEKQREKCFSGNSKMLGDPIINSELWIVTEVFLIVWFCWNLKYTIFKEARIQMSFSFLSDCFLPETDFYFIFKHFYWYHHLIATTKHSLIIAITTALEQSRSPGFRKGGGGGRVSNPGSATYLYYLLEFLLLQGGFGFYNWKTRSLDKVTSNDSSQRLIFPDQLQHFLILCLHCFTNILKALRGLSFMALDPIINKDLIIFFLLTRSEMSRAFLDGFSLPPSPSPTPSISWSCFSIL